ncbi:MAG: helix-turn-helix transcriptional regulator [Patescibacteria group bacterium]|nr:helix-turn-helix transcriptional regulator [Patescibacteria group bacterium]
MLRTAQQKKTLCRDCPVARAADVLGDSCTLLLVRDLLSGSKRFGDLQASLQGISSRTLTNKLKSLEKSGIILHQDAVYILTKKGKGLAPVEKALRTYGKKYL